MQMARSWVWIAKRLMCASTVISRFGNLFKDDYLLANGVQTLTATFFCPRSQHDANSLRKNEPGHKLFTHKKKQRLTKQTGKCL